MITSIHNPKIQRIRALLGRSRERRQADAFVIEGVRLTEELLASGWQAELALYSSELSPRGQELVHRLAANGVVVEETTREVIQSLGDTETTQGLLVVSRVRELPLPAPMDFVLVLDALRDPGNLGTLLRSAAAAGIQAVLLAPGCVDPFSPKVVRSSMGAIFRLPVRSLGWDAIGSLLKSPTQGSPLSVYLAEAAHGLPFWEADLREPLALIIGAEAAGPGAEARALADHVVHIPMPGRSESLNAAIAGSILLFEVVRQRNTSEMPS